MSKPQTTIRMGAMTHNMTVKMDGMDKTIDFDVIRPDARKAALKVYGHYLCTLHGITDGTRDQHLKK